MNLGQPNTYARILTKSPATPRPTLQGTNLVAEAMSELIIGAVYDEVVP